MKRFDCKGVFSRESPNGDFIHIKEYETLEAKFKAFCEGLDLSNIDDILSMDIENIKLLGQTMTQILKRANVLLENMISTN